MVNSKYKPIHAKIAKPNSENTQKTENTLLRLSLKKEKVSLNHKNLPSDYIKQLIIIREAL